MSIAAFTLVAVDDDAAPAAGGGPAESAAEAPGSVAPTSIGRGRFLHSDFLCPHFQQ